MRIITALNLQDAFILIVEEKDNFPVIPGWVQHAVELPPDNLKTYVERLIEDGFSVVVSGELTARCGLKLKEFNKYVEQGRVISKAGSMDELITYFEGLNNGTV
jgi:hypothetical protein